MNILQKISLILTIIGAINWGLIGLFNFNLVDSLFGVDSFLSMLIYILAVSYTHLDVYKRQIYENEGNR